MAKQAPDVTIDSMFDYIDQCTVMHVCSAEPANFAGIAAVSLANVALTINTDFTKANGTVSGRKVTIVAKPGVAVTANGTATHIAIATATELRYVTTCTAQALVSGNTVNIPAWEIEVADPT